MSEQWYKVMIEPLTSLLFRRPGPFEAGLHGPGATARSLAYPLPSTLSGFLAGILVSKRATDKCIPPSGAECDNAEPGSLLDYADVEACLKSVFGDRMRIYTGFLEYNGETYVYLNNPLYLYHIEDAGKLITDEIEEKKARKIEVRRASFTGIALERETKHTMEGMLYTLDRVTYPRGSQIIVYIRTNNNNIGQLRGLLEDVHKLGGKHGMARVLVDSVEKPEYLELGSAEKVLITPIIVELNKLYNKELKLIVNKNIVGKKILELIGENGEIIDMIKGELTIQIITTGYSAACKRPRRPHLLIPPGTIVKTLANDLGDHAGLGWSTLISL